MLCVVPLALGALLCVAVSSRGNNHDHGSSIRTDGVIVQGKIRRYVNEIRRVCPTWAPVPLAFTRLPWLLNWMKLIAFPASEGSSFCTGSGDWPLGPHEILLHPRDLEKLRVPAFGCVSINRGGNSTGTSSSRANTRDRSTYSAGGEEANTRTKEKGEKEKEKEDVLTFCRAVPHDSLQPGEALAPAWLLRAVGLRPRQLLSVFRAVTSAPADHAGGKSGLPTHSFVVKVSRVPPEQRSHTFVDGEGGAAAGAPQQSWSHSRRPAQQQQQQQRPQTIHDRAIARRLSGCLARTGSLLATEVLGKTVLLQVISITDGGTDGIDHSGHGGGPTVSAPSSNADKAAIGDGGGGGGEDAADNFTSCAPRLITPTTEIVVLDSVDRRQFHEDGSVSSSMSSDRRQREASQGKRGTDTPARGLDVRYGGSEEVWTRRAPGLETALGELHALVLLSVGEVADETGNPRRSRPNANDETFQGTGDSAPRVHPMPHTALTPAPEQPLPPPDGHNPSPGRRGGEGAGGVGNRGSGAAVRWSDILPAGTLLCGPSGVGKTLALDILSEDLRERHGVHVVRLLGPQVIAGVTHAGRNSSSGSSKDSPQGTLALALAEARARVPAVLVLDELDAIFDAGGGDENATPLGEVARASSALLQTLDLASAIEGLTVLGATRRSPGGAGGAGWAGQEDAGGGNGAAVPAGFRKPGRFDRCVAIGPPTQAERERILVVLLSVTRGWDLEPLAGSPANDPATGAPKQNDRVRSQAESKGRGSPSLSSASLRAGRSLTERGTTKGRLETQGNEKMDRSEAMAGRSVQPDAVAEWAKRLSSVTPGMVGGDLDRLIRTARARATQRRRNAERRASQTGGPMDAADAADYSRLPPLPPLPPPQQRQPKLPSQQQKPRPQPQQPPPPTVLMWRDVMGAVATTIPRSLRGMDVTSSSGGGGGGDGDGSGGLTWGSVGGFSEAKRRLQRLVQWPWLHPEAFARMGVSAPAGALLYGPSGCGKSLVAQVLATECLANFVWVRSSELLSR